MKAQLEDGYITIARGILDAALATGLTAREWKVLMAVVRLTYGWRDPKTGQPRKADRIGGTQLASLTGLDRGDVARTTRRLIERNILKATPGTRLTPAKLGVNTAVGSWRSELSTGGAGKTPAPNGGCWQNTSTLPDSPSSTKDLQRGAGKTPPPPPAGKTPALHKLNNLQLHLSEEGDAGTLPKKEAPKKKASRRATRMTLDWTPSPRVYAWAQKAGIPAATVDAALDGFRIYWTDTQASRPSWDATYINRLKTITAPKAKTGGNTHATRSRPRSAADRAAAAAAAVYERDDNEPPRSASPPQQDAGPALGAHGLHLRAPME